MLSIVLFLSILRGYGYALITYLLQTYLLKPASINQEIDGKFQWASSTLIFFCLSLCITVSSRLLPPTYSSLPAIYIQNSPSEHIHAFYAVTFSVQASHREVICLAAATSLETQPLAEPKRRIGMVKNKKESLKSCSAACTAAFYRLYCAFVCQRLLQSLSRSPWSCFHGYQTIHLVQNRPGELPF